MSSRMEIMIADMEEYGFDDISQATIARTIDDAHKELCLREPWPFRERQVSFTVPVNTTNITLSNGTMRIVNATSTLDNTVTTSGTYTEYSIGQVLAFVDLTNDVVLQPMRSDAQLKDFVYDADISGIPARYYFIGEQLCLWPKPSSAINVRMRFLTRPLTLSATEADTGNWLWPERHDAVLLYSALSKAYFINDDPQGATMQQAMEARLQTAREDLWMRQYDRTDRVIVLDDNEYLIDY